MKINKYIVLISMCLGLFHISPMRASDKPSKNVKILKSRTEHVVKIEIEIERKSQSLESYFRRIEKLEDIANSCESSKSVDISQWVYTIYMTVEQKKLNKKDAQLHAQSLVNKINQEMTLSQIEVVSIKRKKLL